MHLQLPFESSHHMLQGSGASAPTRHHKSTLHSTSSIPNLRSQKDADVFGKLIGWSYASFGSHALEASTSSDIAAEEAARPGMDSMQQPPIIKHEDRPQALRTPVTSTFAESGKDTARRVREGGPSGETTPKDKSSPFGAGVRLPSSPRLRRKKSFNRRLETQITSPSTKQQVHTSKDSSDLSEALNLDEEIAAPATLRSLRETASSETIRNACQPHSFSFDQAQPQTTEETCTPVGERPNPFPSARTESVFDTSIFDIFQDFAQSETESEVPSTSTSRASLNVDTALHRRHEVSAATVC